MLQKQTHATRYCLNHDCVRQNTQSHRRAEAEPSHRQANALCKHKFCTTYRRSSSGFPCRSGPVLTVTVLNSDSSFDFTQSLLSVSSQVLQSCIIVCMIVHTLRLYDSVRRIISIKYVLHRRCVLSIATNSRTLTKACSRLSRA
jgi:hypothetical protein